MDLETIFLAFIIVVEISWVLCKHGRPVKYDLRECEEKRNFDDSEKGTTSRSRRSRLAKTTVTGRFENCFFQRLRAAFNRPIV